MTTVLTTALGSFIFYYLPVWESQTEVVSAGFEGQRLACLCRLRQAQSQVCPAHRSWAMVSSAVQQSKKAADALHG